MSATLTIIKQNTFKWSRIILALINPEVFAFSIFDFFRGQPSCKTVADEITDFITRV